MTELTYQSEHQKKVDLNVKNDQLKNINTTSFKDSVLDIIYGSVSIYFILLCNRFRVLTPHKIDCWFVWKIN